jgi:hypothetical protein
MQELCYHAAATRQVVFWYAVLQLCCMWLCLCILNGVCLENISAASAAAAPYTAQLPSHSHNMQQLQAYLASRVDVTTSRWWQLSSSVAPQLVRCPAAVKLRYSRMLLLLALLLLLLLLVVLWGASVCRCRQQCSVLVHMQV